MIQRTSTHRFHIAPFAVDGTLVGLEAWPIEQLSPKWLTHCKEFLDRHGPSFDEPWSGKLSHVRTKFTAADAAALVTFSANDRIVCSIALASGKSPAAEASVLAMFVNSLRQSPLVRAAASSAEPFQQVLEIEERPLTIVVPWPDDFTSEQDREVVRELSIHLAAAFLFQNG